MHDARHEHASHGTCNIRRGAGTASGLAGAIMMLCIGAPAWAGDEQQALRRAIADTEQRDASAAPAKASQPAPASTPILVDPRFDTLRRLEKVVEVRWTDVRLEDAMAFIEREAGVEMMVMWLDADQDRGLSREKTITLSRPAVHLRDLLELIAERSHTKHTGEGITWQLTEHGTLQFGPKERLDLFPRTQTYDVANLLMTIKSPTTIMEVGINADTELPSKWSKGDMMDARFVTQRAEDLRQTIIMACEPQAWLDNGGLATIRWNWGSNAMVVRAPDYVHRAIDGYRFWPGGGEPVTDRLPDAPQTPATPARPHPTQPTGTPAGS